MGFHGSFYADPETLDVRRMEVVAEDIPADLGICRLRKQRSTIAGCRIGDEEFLLPVESQIDDGDARRSESELGSVCGSAGKFTGESTLRFDDPILTDDAARRAPRQGS